MAKHKGFQADRRQEQAARMREIEAAWRGSLSKADAQAFETAVAAARSRPPAGPPPNQPPGTIPNPPRVPPKPKKEERPRRG